MITDGQEFLISNLGCLTPYSYAYLGQNGDRFYFLYRKSEEDKNIYYKAIDKLDEDDIKDKMWNDFDSHDEWVEAVKNGDTEESYDDWSSDIDIYDYRDEGDFYGADESVCNQLYNLGLWEDENDDYDSYNYMYLDTEGPYLLNEGNIRNVLRYLDTNGIVNQDLVDDLQTYFHCNEMEFLECEDIR